MYKASASGWTAITFGKEIQFESGRARTYLKNSKATNIFSFLLTFEDHTGAGSEYKRFLDWWDNSLHGLAGSFEFPDLITHTGTKEYRAIEDYNVTGQKFKEVSLTVSNVLITLPSSLNTSNLPSFGRIGVVFSRLLI